MTRAATAALEASAVAVLLGGHLTAFANATLERAEGRGVETAQYLFSPGDLANDSWQTLDDAYRIANGFNGSHQAPGRSVFVRTALSL